jgi:tetratricopeptide (TPR) repeat protein
MRFMRRFALASISIAFAAAMASAAPTPPRAEPKSSATPTATAEDESAAANRALAEQEYKKGYKDAQEATKLEQSGKSADATARFGKALKHFEAAIATYEPYAEAWNMVGYCARNVGDLKRAFDAYDRSLAIDPDLAEAHEYVGEAYLMTGNVEKAKEQLAWLTAKESKLAAELAAAIDAAEKGKAPAERKGWGAPEPDKPPAAAATSDSTASDSTGAR